MKREYRIVRDEFAGYEVQHRWRGWPFWAQVNFINTFSTIEEAEAYAREKAAQPLRNKSFNPDVVKYLGILP